MSRSISILLAICLSAPAGCARAPRYTPPLPCEPVDLPRQVGDPPPRPVDLPLRYDGVYQSAPVMTSWGRDSIPAWSFLRFYPDGRVVATATAGRPYEIGDLSIEDESLPAGVVTVRDGRLSFSIRVGNCPSVDHEGELVGDRLHLRIHSRIDGWRGETVYTFVRGAAGIAPAADGGPE